MTEINTVALRKLLADHFSPDELRILCFDLGEKLEKFAGGETGTQALSLKIVEHFERGVRLQALLDEVERQRPGLYAKYLSVELDLERERDRQAKEAQRRRERKFERVVNPPPATVRETFKDRAKEMKDLCDHLADAGVRLISVVGRGGIGKTALVSKVFAEIEHGQWPAPTPGPPSPVPSEREREKSPFILYLDKDKLTLEHLYAGAVRMLGPDAADELAAFYKQPGALADKAHFLLSRLREGVYLMVMDNLESVLLPDGAIADEGLRVFVEACLCAGHGVKLVITSREDVPLSPAALACARRVRLDQGLPENDAIALLRQLDPDGAGGLKDAPESLLRQAAVKVHGVPYAIERIAGILRATPDLSLERLLADRDLFSGQVIENLAEYGYTRLTESARRVIEALAVFDRPVTETAARYLLLPFAPEVDVAGELRRLAREMFVTANRVTGTFALHPLDREVAYKRLQDVGARHASPLHAHDLELRAAAYYAETRKPQEEWKTIDDLQPQLAEFEHRVRAGDYDRAGWLLDEIDFNYLQLWGHALRVIEMREKLIGHHASRTLERRNWGYIGTCYRDIGQVRRAIECYERALELARADHERQAEGAWLGNLGLAYLDLGETRQAIEFYEQALAIDREIGDQRGEDAILGNLGSAYYSLGETRRAIEFHEQALAIDREIGDRRGEGADLCNLGSAYLALGETQRAIEFYEKAKEVAIEIGDRRSEGKSLGNLGNAYYSLGETRRAIEFCEQALAIRREIGDRSGEGIDLYNLSEAHQTLGDFAQASTCAEQSLALDMPETAYSAAIRLGILAAQSQSLSDAARYFDLAIAKCRELLDKTPELYEALYAYGTALAGQAAVGGPSSTVNGLSSAVEIYQRAMSIFAGPTVLKGTLRDLRYLRQSAGCEGLEPAIQLLMRDA